ncbi:MAG: cytochrome o ubiquinol oxidase subunit IV [Gammaproteobacteria bacterium]
MAHLDTHVENTSGQKTLSGYLIGFGLCIILTIASFGLVVKQVLTETNLYIALSVLAVIQLIVQSVFFIRLNASKEGQWNLLPFLFILLIIGILVGGSLWIMYNLDFNMAH